MLTARIETLPHFTPIAHSSRLHRSLLRLRARWLRWRGRAVLRAVAAAGPADRPPLPVDAGFAGHRRTLLQLNLAFERARAMPASGAPHGTPQRGSVTRE